MHTQMQWWNGCDISRWPKPGTPNQMAMETANRSRWTLDNHALTIVQHHRTSFLKELALLVPFFDSSMKLDAATQTMQWRWTASKTFTCSSAYRMMSDSGVRSVYHRVLWKLRVPMKVRVFLWLLMNDKILTQEVLAMRGCAVTQGCALCNNGLSESSEHLMRTCPYAWKFWRGLCIQQNLPIIVGSCHTDIWWDGRVQLTGHSKERWDVTWAAGSWALWKERNRRTFTPKRKLEDILINDASTDIHNWLLFS